MSETQECGICEKAINEQSDDYEIIETFLEGNHEDLVYLHTDCRYRAEKKTSNKIKLRMKFLEKQGMKESPEYHSLESILDEKVEK